MRGLNSVRDTSCLRSWTAGLRNSLSCRGQGQAAAQAVEVQAAELPAAEPGRPLRRTRGLWGATGVRRPAGPETLVVPPAVPLGGPPAAAEGGRGGAGAGASESGGADADSSKASTSMADLTRVLHVSHPARAVPGPQAAFSLQTVHCALTKRCLGFQGFIEMRKTCKLFRRAWALRCMWHRWAWGSGDETRG